jgi:two-component system response regulator CssR
MSAFVIRKGEWRMPGKIYMVEDEKNLNILLQKYLQNEGYDVTTFADGSSAAEKVRDLPDLWILDIMLPGLDGYELIEKIKAHRKDTPVIFMSARNEELDRVVGLELGGDDYLSKPFLPRELVIRVNKLMARIYRTEQNAEFCVSRYKICENQRSVWDGDTEISLTGNEFDLLLCFVRHQNQVLSREQILDQVWGHDYFGSDRVVDDTIRRLRKKLNALELDTVYGYGYKLSDKP